MANINVEAFSEKGVLRQFVKQNVKKHEVEQLTKALAETEYEQGKKDSVFVKSYFDANGREFYAVLEFKTTSLHPDEAAKPKTKSTKKEPVEFVIE